MYRKYLLPMGIILCLSLLLRWLDAWLADWMVIVLRCCGLFCFGMSLNFGKHKKYETWLRKVIISFVLIFFLVWELGYVMIPQLKSFFDVLGLYGYIVYLIYIYCGWAFFD